MRLYTGSSLFGETVRYSIDTSALIDAWHEAYTPRTFPGVWDNMERLIYNGILMAPYEVKEELGFRVSKQDEIKEELDSGVFRQQSDLLRWVQARKGFFVAQTPEIEREFIAIVHKFRRFARHESTRPYADPHIVALAKAENCIVVTQETMGKKRVKIPNACAYYKIPCINLFEFVNGQGWSFISPS